MNTIEHQENSTALIDTGDSYELKHILSVATAYLDTEQIDDAEDLLKEANEIDADHPDVTAFARRLDHARGRSTISVTSNADSIDALPDVLVNFTRPLPGVESQTTAVQRLIRDAEGHYVAERLFSALDSTYLACVEAPMFLPGFVRLAELQLALGKTQQARNLFDTLSYWHEINDEPPNVLVRALQISLDPSDTAALLEYAMILVDNGEISALEPYVPAAIARAVETNPTAARDLSQRYLQLCPENLDAQRLHLQVLTTTGESDALITAARTFVVPSSPIDLLVFRIIAESKSSSEEWLTWLEIIAGEMRAEPSAHAIVREILDTAKESLTAERFRLLSAVVAFSAGRWLECADSLRFSSPSEQQPEGEAFVSRMILALALDHLDDPAASSVMLDAVRLAFLPDVEAFAGATEIFGVSASPTELLKTTMGLGGSAIAALQTLRDANPERLEVRGALAATYMETGNAREAVRELRYIAQEHEKIGNLSAMVQAMRQISQAVPANVEMKAKLIEGYLRRGVLDEAIVELDLIGELYRDRNRTADAVAAFTRAAEIASATGAFTRGNALFQKAVEANPDDVPVRHAAVAFYLQTGSIGQAAAQLREVVRIALVTEDRDEAVAALHQIIALAPQDSDAYHQLGEVLTSLGEYTQAERVYRRLATFSPHDLVLEAKQSALAVLAATK
ncbi:hypothetical protein BH24CHL1_BH24CHL1_04830 [soil metagenome]